MMELLFDCGPAPAAVAASTVSVGADVESIDTVAEPRGQGWLTTLRRWMLRA